MASVTRQHFQTSTYRLSPQLNRRLVPGCALAPSRTAGVCFPFRWQQAAGSSANHTAPIVQRIERPPPKRQIQVRFLVGAPFAASASFSFRVLELKRALFLIFSPPTSVYCQQVTGPAIALWLRRQRLGARTAGPGAKKHSVRFFVLWFARFATQTSSARPPSSTMRPLRSHRGGRLSTPEGRSCRAQKGRDSPHRFHICPQDREHPLGLLHLIASVHTASSAVTVFGRTTSHPHRARTDPSAGTTLTENRSVRSN